MTNTDVTNKPIPTRVGQVVKISSDKTIMVLVESTKKHFTGKVIKVHRKYMAHDENNSAKLNSTVKIKEGRKISKNKSWHLAEVIAEAGDN